MAKDRDKQQATLFDDKSITFQRAVFIVCNLKRLIKRPKKDDKYSINSSGGSRKRSGTGDINGCDRSPLGPGGGGKEGTHDMCPDGSGGHYASGKLRFRNPIRRAFTLPTILCGSFIGLSHQQQPQQRNDQQEQESGSMESSSEDYQDYHDHEDQEMNGPETERPCEFAYSPWNEPPSSRCQVVINAGLSPTSSRARRRVRHSQPGSGASSTTLTLASRRESPVNFGAYDCDRSRGGECSLASAVSCLATPTRRIGPHSPAGPQMTTSDHHSRHHHHPHQHHRRAHSSQNTGFLAQQSATTTYNQPARLMDCHGYNQLNSAGSSSMNYYSSSYFNQQLKPNEAGLQRDPSSRQSKTATTASANQSQVCCPIWALAMELLDSSQAQPRDQSRHDHLLGPPSSLSYLLAPAVTASKLDSQSPDAIQLDGCTSSVATGIGRSSRAGSPTATTTGGTATGGQSSENEDDEDGTGSTTSDQMGRMRMKRFSSSALCLNNDNDHRQNGKTSGGGGGAPNETRCRQSSSKRASTDKQHRGGHGASGTMTGSGRRDQSSHRTSASSATNDDVTAATSSSKRTKTKKPTITVSSLAAPAEDPIVQLARQRRPSVSNQGSLNVDQQALFSAVECNQLERVKSILDDGKVNVNSLNGDKLTCLDVAVLLRNLAMVRLLQHYKAKESSAYLTSEGRENQLYSLYMEARRLVEDLSRSVGAIASPQAGSLLQVSHGTEHQPSSASSSTCDEQLEPPMCCHQDSQKQQPPQQLMLATGSLLSSALFEEKQRQLQYWRRRLDLFMQMRYGFEKLDVPRVPELVVLQVVGENSLGLKIVHSLGQINELFSSLSQHQLQLQDQQRQQKQLQQHPASFLGADQFQQLALEGQLQPLPPPMSRLIGEAQERRLHCPLGPKCSHWLMDEIVAYRQNSDQFQTYDPDDLLVQRHCDHSSRTPEVRSKHQTAKFRQDQTTASSRSSLMSGAKTRQQQEKLAIFNQLLAQQLTILSNQQRQQQQLELLQSSRHKLLASGAGASSGAAPMALSAARVPKPMHPHQQLQHQQLIYAHQIESTDSAYDQIAAAAASSCQQQQQASSLLPFLPAGSTVIAQQQQPHQPAYLSLAYQLMTARRYNDTLVDHLPVQGATSVNGGARMTSSGSVKFSSTNQADQQPAGPSMASAAAHPMMMNQHDPTLAAAGTQQLHHSTSSITSTIITKYKVEWSTSSSFEPVQGSMIIYNTNSYPLECQIGNLENGRAYFVRVSSGNHKGFSPARLATPPCLAPSSWRQLQPANTNTTTTTNRASNTTTTTSSNTIATTTKKKFKYDEEVFRKFTKLILLNKHILDENQLNWLQREQQQLRMEGASGGSASASSSGGGAMSKWAANKMANLQNKSSLINMLLLDATMPTAAAAAVPSANDPVRMGLGSADDTQHPNSSLSANSGSSFRSGGSGSRTSGVSLGTNDSISHQFHMTAASSPRGSLYPVASSGSTTGANTDQDNDSLLSGQSSGCMDQQQQQTSLKVRKNLRHLFQSNSTKFNKLNNQNKRGLYLATIVYHTPSCGNSTGSSSSNSTSGHSKTSSSSTKQRQQPANQAGDAAGQSSGLSNAIKLVVTNDDRLPIIEILNDLVAPSSLMADFYWLLKINGTSWIDMKRLRQQLQRSHSSSTLHLRIKLLAAIEQMQLALNLEDIGRLFYKPIQAHDGSIVICTCRSVTNTKLVSNLSIKWTSQHKLIPRHLRKISDLIAASNRERERHQEQQMRQQQLARSSLASLTTACNHQQQQLALNKRHSSSAMSSSMGTRASAANMDRGTTGLSSDNLQAAAANWTTAVALNPIMSSCASSVAPNQVDQVAASSAVATGSANASNSSTFNLMASSASNSTSTTATTTTTPAELDQQPTRLPSAASTTSQTLLPEVAGRLCEICQAALVQRRCTMASGSSSSSLASNESQSWSSSQFSLNSNQQQQQPTQTQQMQTPVASRSCTCSRSNSSVTAQTVTGAGATSHSYHHHHHQNYQNRLSTASNQLQLATSPGSSNYLGSSQAIASAPTSQRNSTQSARSASGGVGMMMMMMGHQGGHNHHQSSGSFSLVNSGSLTAGGANNPTGGSLSGPSMSLASGRSSQQVNASESQVAGASPQSSSTYLMLASLSLYDLLLFHLKEIIEFDQTSTTPLKRGLYLGFIQLQTTVESMRLLVPRKRPNMLPCARIRDNAHVSREEWELLKRFVTISAASFTTGGSSGELTTGHKLATTSRPDPRGPPASQGSGPASKINALSGSVASSRCSDPAIWRLQPGCGSATATATASATSELPRSAEQGELEAPSAQVSTSQRPEHQLESQQQKHSLGPSSNAGFERDRAKSVSPGLIQGNSAILRDSAINRAKVLACVSKQQQQQEQQQHQNQDSLLKPSLYSSCNIGERDAETERADEAQPHAHSDTDLALSLSSSSSSSSSPPELVATETPIQSSSEPTVLMEVQEQPKRHPVEHSEAHSMAPPTPPPPPPSSCGLNKKEKNGSSGSIAVTTIQQSPEMTFVRLIGDAARRLLLELKSQLPKMFDETKQELVSILASLNDEENNRIYHMELIELSNQVSFILLIPTPENVCPVTSNERSNILAHNQDYMLLPLQIFETIHLSTYEPDLLGKYSRLSTILETDLIVAQHDHRQAFSSNELKSTKSRVSHLQDMVSIADEFWRQLRWIVDVVSFARDKSQLGTGGASNDHMASSSAASSGSIKLGAIWSYFDQLTSNPRAGCCSVAPMVQSPAQSSLTRKSVESVALSLTTGGGSQQDLVGGESNTPSLAGSVHDRKHGANSALIKTNSSNGSESRSTTAGGVAATEDSALNRCELGDGHQQELKEQPGERSRQEITRTSSARLQGTEHSSNHNGHRQEPTRDRIPSAGSATQRPRLPEIQLPSSEFKIDGQEGGERPAPPETSGTTTTGYKREPRVHPGSDEPQTTNCAQRGGALSRRRRHSQTGAESGPAGGERSSSPTSSTSPRAIHHHHHTDHGSARPRHRAESCWQVSGDSDERRHDESGSDLAGGLTGRPTDYEHHQDDDDDEDQASSCFEESILNVQFGECGQDVVLVSQDDGFVVGYERLTDSDNSNNNNNQEDLVGVDSVAGADVDDDDEAIYAYHISLRDATKAAAKRKSSQQLINLFIDQGEPPPPSTAQPPASSLASRSQAAEAPITNKDELRSTCGGLNLDRRQFGRFALAAAAAEPEANNTSAGSGKPESGIVARESDSHRQARIRTDTRPLAQGDFCFGLGDVIAYKFKKVPPSAATRAAAAAAADPTATTTSTTTASRVACSGQAKQTAEGAQVAGENNGPTTNRERRTSQFKSTNPFLTDSFEL